MNARAKQLKFIGVAGAAALIAGTMAAPALAAGDVSASVNYSCVALNGAATVHPAAAYTVAAPPASLVAGQLAKLATTSTFNLSTTDTTLAGGALGATAISGTIKTSPSNAGVGLNLSFPKTSLGNNGGATKANATGNTLLRFTKAGTFTLKLADIGKVHLQGYDTGGNRTSAADFPDAQSGNGPCNNDAGTTTLKDSSSQSATVAVAKDKTTTVATAAYNAKKDVAKGKAKVRSHFGLRATGKVVFILKKGTTRIAKASDTLNKKGIATHAFKHVKKHGKYSITAKYVGNKALKRSSGKDTFRVR